MSGPDPTLHGCRRSPALSAVTQTLPPPTFMSLRWRYSSMMALDFFSSSSSDSAAFGGLMGGRVASRFTEGDKTNHKLFSSSLSGEHLEF